MIVLDRSNIGNARTMPQSIESVLGGDPTGALFNWISVFFDSLTIVAYYLFREIASVFYFSYV